MRPDTRDKVTSLMAEFWRLPPDGISRLKELAADDEVLAAMLTIRCLLADLFRDKEVEREWMNAPNQGLDTNSPLYVMLSDGKGALKVKELVWRIGNPDFT